MPKTVLIVDDSAIVRRVLREFLRRHSEVDSFQEASDGREAIACVRQVRPDLIILDLSMPGMGGVRAAAELKHLAPEVPILLFSMHYARAEEFGVDAVVSKVDGWRLLAERVRYFLAESTASSFTANS